jgi:thiol-disulfide isomerase/thioredoxin
MAPPASEKKDRLWWITAIGFALFWMAFLAFYGPTRPGLFESPGPDLPVDYNWTLLDLQDRPVSFADFRGKTVFLNIWATWCGPCVGEMPSIAKMAADPRLQGKDIAVVCVSTDDSSETVRRFLEGKSWTMTILRAESLPLELQTEGIPATFVISPGGRIVAAEVGAARWDDPAVFDFLEKVATGSSTSG